MEIKKKIIFFIVCLFLTSLVYALGSPPDLPDHFMGNLTIDDQDAAIGTEIKIYVNDELEDTIITTVIGEYDLYVKTGNSGDEIKFKVSDVDAATSERQGGETITLNLAVYLPEPETPPSGDSGSGSSGGGGGGGGGGGTAARNPNEASRFFASLTDKYHALMAINSPNIPINRLSFNVDKQLFMVRVNVKALDESSTPVKISGKVYQYLDLSTENLKDEDLSQPVEIKFKVTKEWLGQKDVGKEEISLYRYKEKWNKLDTEIEREDNSDVFYISKTPGFSIFAIGVMGETEKTKPEEELEEKLETKEEVPAITEIEGGEVKKESGGFFAITGRAIASAYKENPLGTGFLTIFIIVIITVAIYKYKNKKSKPKNNKKL